MPIPAPSLQAAPSCAGDATRTANSGAGFWETPGFRLKSPESRMHLTWPEVGITAAPFSSAGLS